MWNDLTTPAIPYLNLVVRAFVVYFAIVLLLRVSGKRQLGQMSGPEFVAILLISNAVQNSMNGGDNSLTGGLVLASVLIFLSWAVEGLNYYSPTMSRIFEGSPTVLMVRGKMIDKNLRRERLTHKELRVLLRKQGIHDLAAIESAILESDGTLSIAKVEPTTGQSSPHKA